MNKLYGLLLLCLAVPTRSATAQALHTDDPYGLNGQGRRSGFSNDSTDTETVNVPEGLYAWKVSPRFGDIRPAQYDTIPHRFQNANQTMGMLGHYNYTGNLGSPRISRHFNEQNANMQENPFIFKLPYSFFLPQVGDLLFTNTK